MGDGRHAARGDVLGRVLEKRSRFSYETLRQDKDLSGRSVGQTTQVRLEIRSRS